jgi:hypothetical protein
MHRRMIRPAHCVPGSMANRTKEMAERMRLSRGRLLTSNLKQNTRAWRLWAACVEATVGYTREADQTYVVGLARQAAMERQVASQLLQQFNELGVFGWQSGPRGSHTPGMLTLPGLSGGQSGTMTRASGGQSGTMSPAPQGVRVAPLHNSELSIEGMDGTAPFDGGTHHSPLNGPSDRVEASDDWHAERRAIQEARPELAALTREELVRLAHARPEKQAAIRAELARREAEPDPTLAKVLARFGDPGPGSFDGDERTGDTTGDDEASQLRWQGANPSKARARRRRD